MAVREKMTGKRWDRKKKGESKGMTQEGKEREGKWVKECRERSEGDRKEKGEGVREKGKA